MFEFPSQVDPFYQMAFLFELCRITPTTPITQIKNNTFGLDSTLLERDLKITGNHMANCN